MSSGQSSTSCGRDVDGGHFLRIGDVGTRSTVVGGDGWRLASGRDSWTFGSKTKRPTLLCRQHLHQCPPSRLRSIGGSKTPAIGLTKGGHNSKLTAAVDERGHFVALLFFPGQCAETTAAKQGLPLQTKIMDLGGDKCFDSDELRHLIEDNGGLACLPPRSNSTNHRWCDPEFNRKEHVVENIYQRIKNWRSAATRYEKLASTFLAFSTLATSIDYIRRQ
jgi:transposase